MIIYLDVLIAENFIVNYFLLHLTSKSLKIKYKVLNLSIAATIGAFYTIVLIFKQLNIFSALPFKLLLAIIMVYVTNKSKNVVTIIKQAIIFIFYSFLLAGFCVFIEMNKGKKTIGYGYLNNFTYKNIIISLIIIYFVLNKILFYIKEKKVMNNYIFEVDVINKGNKITVQAFLDTGNELSEPITSHPVILIEKQYFKDYKFDLNNKYYIPYKMFNGASGYVIGFKPDYVVIHENEQKIIKNVIVAFTENKLCEDNQYEALLSMGLFI